MTRHAAPDRRSPVEELAAWWERKRAGRAMPLRAELSPRELAGILRDLFLVGVSRDAASGKPVFDYRLTGSRIDDRLKVNITGQSFPIAAFGNENPKIEEQYTTCVAERRPILCTHKFVVSDSRYVEYDRYIAPLAGPDGETVVALIGAVRFACAFDVERGRGLQCPILQGCACDRPNLCVPEWSGIGSR